MERAIEICAGTPCRQEDTQAGISTSTLKGPLPFERAAERLWLTD